MDISHQAKKTYWSQPKQDVLSCNSLVMNFWEPRFQQLYPPLFHRPYYTLFEPPNFAQALFSPSGKEGWCGCESTGSVPPGSPTPGTNWRKPRNGVGPRGDFLVFAIYTLSNFTINIVNILRLVKLAKCVILKVNCLVQLGYFSLSSYLLLFLIS